jgi:hypothetical protein
VRRLIEIVRGKEAVKETPIAALKLVERVEVLRVLAEPLEVPGGLPEQLLRPLADESVVALLGRRGSKASQELPDESLLVGFDRCDLLLSRAVHPIKSQGGYVLVFSYDISPGRAHYKRKLLRRA